MSKKPSVLWCSRDIFYSCVAYTIITNEEDFWKEVQKLGVPREIVGPWVGAGSNARTHKFVYHEEGKSTECAVIAFPASPDRDPEEVIGLIVHEAMHVWQWILEGIGESKPSCEFEAYSVQSIVQSLLREYKRQVYGL